MNVIKSTFVSLYMMLAVLVSAYAVQLLLATGDYMTWGGVLLVYVPFLVVLSWLMMARNMARTSSRFPVLIILGIAGVVVSGWGYLQSGDQIAPILAIAGFAAFLAYDYWYSSFGRSQSSLIGIGKPLPVVEFRNTAGKMISSASLTAKPTVWIFYRGNWCPLCMAQIKEVAAQYQQLEELGVRVALISPQPHKFTVGLAKKFDVAFYFLTDEGNQAARTLGIDHDFGVPMGMQVLGYSNETVMPTVIITDAGGRILWVDETDNYRVRPDPETYLGVLRDRR